MTLKHQRDQADFKAILPEEIDWKPFPAFPAGARLAIMVGHPAEPGPYMVRVKLPTDAKLMPHKHPEDRIYTVMSRVFYIGLGEIFDAENVQAYPPGSALFRREKPGISIGEVRPIRHAGDGNRPAWS
ncbi:MULTISPECIES: cupin domain-containing protein [Bradyrhizobium]|uniref:cupin domain-containing protein n=1 Tax=Bradyrhizobium TaxID=374 RepID=UPI001F0A8F5F|nr:MULTISPECIES: cupin domain-containing protein [Bradyrhizobium]WOH56854.1 cupin domain-containing protein [Bradyrhizobium sp. BWC-3-1]